MPKINIPFESLLADLHSTDWQKRCDAARLLGQSDDPRAVEALLPDLQDPNWRVRRNAVQALGALKSKDSINAILGALKDRVATVRERSAVALGRIKDPSTIPALIEALVEGKGAQIHINEGAYQAIRKFGRKAGPALIEALKAHPNIYLVELLAESKFEVDANLFIELAGGADPAMRRAALKALGKTGHPVSLDFLIKLLDSGDIEAQTLAVQSIGQLRAVETALRLLDLLQDGQLVGPRAALYRAISETFQQFADLKKDLEAVSLGKSTLSFGVSGAAVSLSEMMGMLGNDNFQRINQMLANAEGRAQEIGEQFNLPAEVVQNLANQTWKFGAMLADARDTKTERVALLIRLLKAETPLKRTAAALALPWYFDIQAMEPLESATRDDNEMVRRASTWACQALKNPAGYQK